MSESDKRMRLVHALVNMDEASVLEQARERLAYGDDPYEIMEDANTGLFEVGRRYEEGQFFVAALMFGGEMFREVMDLVQPYLVPKVGGNESNKILLATVQGDIHDIGKNVFSTILRSNDFAVTDLGVDIPPERIYQAALDLQPDILGLHGLLTTSYEPMKETVRLIRSASDPDLAGIPIILGGGTINAMVCGFVGADFWATDARVGVDLCKQMMAKRR